MKNLRMFLSKICKYRRQLIYLHRSYKPVTDNQILQIENVLTWKDDNLKKWCRDNWGHIKQVCPQKFYKELEIQKAEVFLG